MAISDYEQQDKVTTGDIRSIVGDIAGGNFHHFIDGAVGNYWGVSRCLFLTILFVGQLMVLSHLIPNLPLFALQWLVGLAPIWVPIALIIGAWKVWLWYVRALYIAKIDPLLLEVKFPKNLVKSPRAMEVALANMWIDSGVTTFFNRVWQGGILPFFSLEMTSFGGEVHFYVWCWRGWRRVVESTLYAQYPEIELVEVEDYASKFKYDPEKYEVFGTDWRFEPKNDAYPIKTYVDFELDKDPKEEYKIDPLAEVVERLSSLKPNEQMWIQIICTQSKDNRKKPGGRFWDTESRYTGIIKQAIEDLRKETVGNPDKPEEKWKSYARVQLYRYTELVRSMDRQMGKHPFNVGARGVYITDPDNFSAPGYTGLRWIWRPMGNPQYGNQLRPRRYGNPFDWPWQDLWDFRWRLHHRRFFDAYRRRSYFYVPWVTPYMMMSTETIATIWHPPSTAIPSPGLQRIPAKKAEPPANLPK